MCVHGFVCSSGSSETAGFQFVQQALDRTSVWFKSRRFGRSRQDLESKARERTTKDKRITPGSAHRPNSMKRLRFKRPSTHVGWVGAGGSPAPIFPMQIRLDESGRARLAHLGHITPTKWGFRRQPNSHLTSHWYGAFPRNRCRVIVGYESDQSIARVPSSFRLFGPLNAFEGQ